MFETYKTMVLGNKRREDDSSIKQFNIDAENMRLVIPPGPCGAGYSATIV